MKTTRTLALSIATIAVLSFAASHADARPRPNGHIGGKSFEANKTFGLGLELGEPSGLNGKYFVSSNHALDFGLGYMYNGYYYGDGIHLYADYLWHPLSLVSADAFELPFYIGVGGRFWNFDYGCDRFGNNCGANSSAIGVRVPIGISFDLNNVPLDIYVQIVPALDFFTGAYRYHNDRIYLDFGGNVGIRFWFN
jgi:hypothetical protein